jgi:hypothetical protein
LSWICSGVCLGASSVSCIGDVTCSVGSDISWRIGCSIGSRVASRVSCGIGSRIGWLHQFVFTSSLFSY